MAAAPATGSFERRAPLFAALAARNRRVGVLRIIVPAVGLAAFAGLAGQIYLTGLMREFGVSGIRVDRGNLVVETPQYSGTGSAGARYLVTAREARTPLARPGEIEMTNATLEYSRPGQATYFVTTAAATADTAAQRVTIPGDAAVTGADGLEAALTDIHADMAAETVTAGTPVSIRLANGTTIDAATMVHDGKAGLWTFTGATVVVPDLPAAEPAAAPDEAAP